MKKYCYKNKNKIKQNFFKHKIQFFSIENSLPNFQNRFRHSPRY